ncbi:MAG: phosphoribosylglycinamide formyltransferase [Bacteroidales bacterium]|nr:phosphoribosylglycinamide formyltransferase [Bacteroidales bacterium]
MKRNIAVFASGSGSNFEAIARACADGTLNARIAVCVVDKPRAYAIVRAESLGIPVLVLSPKDFPSKREYEKEIADRLDRENVELVCLAGYMRIVGDELLSRYGGKIINIHPALLPAFPGAHAIEDSFRYGVKVFGVTIHYVDETLDGGKIISQVAVPYEGSDIAELEAMIHKAEHKLYVDTVRCLLCE